MHAKKFREPIEEFLSLEEIFSVSLAVVVPTIEPPHSKKQISLVKQDGMSIIQQTTTTKDQEEECWKKFVLFYKEIKTRSPKLLSHIHKFLKNILAFFFRN